MDLSILQQIGQVSEKVLFLYLVPERRLAYLSPAAAALWQAPLGQLTDAPAQLFSAVHPHDQAALQQCFDLLLSGKKQEQTFRLILPDSTQKTVSIDAYPVYQTGNDLYALTGMAQDITAPTQQLAYLKEFGHKKNSALEIVAHDLQGPLALMKNISELLEHDVQQKLYDELGTYTSLIQRAYKDCSNLINSVLSEEHLKSPKILVKPERFNVIDKILPVMQNYQLAPNIDTALQLIPPPHPLEVALDEVKFMQIINNLISNSIKFTPPQGKINITVAQEGRWCKISHQDNGIGIPDDLKPYVFERHSRASRTGLKGEKSTGIGLSIVKELVEIQGGSIWFESQENKGTTFFLTFPLLQETPATGH